MIVWFLDPPSHLFVRPASFGYGSRASKSFGDCSKASKSFGHCSRASKSFYYGSRASKSFGYGSRASKSTTSIVDKMITALTQSNITTLGVYGSSNAYVVEQITRRVLRDEVFDVVVDVMASVMKKNTWYRWWSKSPDVRRIQEQLGSKLGLQFHHKTTSKERATRLCERIKMEAKIIIILDDLRGKINLAKIGIPFGNDHKGCKILLVAQSQKLLANQVNPPQIEFSTDD
ncbi:putative disease resistance protein, partial [Mucuna pruriens]